MASKRKSKALSRKGAKPLAVRVAELSASLEDVKASLLHEKQKVCELRNEQTETLKLRDAATRFIGAGLDLDRAEQQYPWRWFQRRHNAVLVAQSKYAESLNAYRVAFLRDATRREPNMVSHLVVNNPDPQAWSYTENAGGSGTWHRFLANIAEPFIEQHFAMAKKIAVAVSPRKRR